MKKAAEPPARPAEAGLFPAPDHAILLEQHIDRAPALAVCHLDSVRGVELVMLQRAEGQALSCLAGVIARELVGRDWDELGLGEEAHGGEDRAGLRREKNATDPRLTRP